MRLLAAICLLLAVPLGAFSWWGGSTADGRHAFDEMAGIVPFAAGVAAVLLLVVSAIAWWWSVRRRRAAQPARRVT